MLVCESILNCCLFGMRTTYGLGYVSFGVVVVAVYVVMPALVVINVAEFILVPAAVLTVGNGAVFVYDNIRIGVCLLLRLHVVGNDVYHKYDDADQQ